MKRLISVLVGFATFILFSAEGLGLPPCADTFATSVQQTRGWDNCFGNLHFERGRFKGDKYVGEFKNGKGHGVGTYFWVYGDKYVGEFKNGIAHGKGIFTDASGKVYEGLFANGQYQHPEKP